MKKIFATLVATALTASMVLTGCNKGGDVSAPSDQGSGTASDVQVVDANNGSFDASGKYTPATGDNYIGVRLEIERNNAKGSWELYMICQGDLIADCGTNEYIPGFRKNNYLGKPYWDGIRDFIGLTKAEPGVVIINIGASITENEEFENYRSRFDEGIREHLGEMPYDSAAETKDKFNEIVRISNENYDHGEWKALVDGEGGGSVEEPDNPGDPQQGSGNPGDGATVNSVDELVEGYKKGIDHFKLSHDISIDVSKDDCYGVNIDCDGHHVEIRGELDGAKAKGRDTLFDLENASSVDMSNLSVSEASFNKDDFVKCNVGIVNIRNTSYKKVVWPSNVKENPDDRDRSPLAGMVKYQISDEGDQMSLEYRGPTATYEERQAYETKLVKAVLTKGDTKSVSADPKHREDCSIWTEVTVNVGSAKLPNQDYQEIIIMPGGKLTIKGTVTVTGGTLAFTIKGKNGECLDLTGLKLTKKHPSPDMCKIRFPKGTKINEKKLKPKATSGKIKFSKGDTEFAITIW